MTSRTWVVILCVLMFAVGWTSNEVWGLLGDEPAATPDAVEPDDDDSTRRSRQEGGRNRFSRGRRGGGYIFPELALIEKLGISEGKQLEIDKIVQSVQDKLVADERAQRDYVDQRRQELNDLLSDEEKQALEEAVAARWRNYCDEKLESYVAWYREQQPDTTSENVDQFRQIVSESLQKQFEAMRAASEKRSGKDRGKIMDEIHQARDERLRAFLGDEALEVFLRQESPRRRGRGGRAFREREGGPPSRHGSRGDRGPKNDSSKNESQ